MSDDETPGTREATERISIVMNYEHSPSGFHSVDPVGEVYWELDFSLELALVQENEYMPGCWP